MNVVDTSGWLEYFADGPNASFFAPAIETPDQLVISTINVYEVFKHIARQRDEDSALKAVAVMGGGSLVNLDDTLAMDAARLSILHRLPMADSLILATARACDAVLWTQDADFEGLDRVRFVARRTAG